VEYVCTDHYCFVNEYFRISFCTGTIALEAI
jgi:hypothetical protein